MHADDPDEASIVGLRISDEASQPDFYCIKISNTCRDYYLCVNSKLLIFKDAGLVPDVGARLLREQRIVNVVTSEPDLICDLPGALRLITEEDVDDRAVILNFLNAAFDIVRQVGCVIPGWAERDLYKIADHLTFNKEFSSFLRAENLMRDELCNAICLCAGLVLPRIFFVDENCLSLYPLDSEPSVGTTGG
jgi:hypothetical protein